jgi:hypothetical protein
MIATATDAICRQMPATPREFTPRCPPFRLCRRQIIRFCRRCRDASAVFPPLPDTGARLLAVYAVIAIARCRDAAAGAADAIIYTLPLLFCAMRRRRISDADAERRRWLPITIS